MSKWIKAGLIALGLLVGLADSADSATTYNVPTPTSLASAMSLATGDDVVQLAPGTYAASALAPSNAGTAGHFIHIIGNPANPASVKLTGGGFNIAKDYISVNGINIAWDGSHRTSLTFTANHDSVANCVIDSGTVAIQGAATANDTTTVDRNDIVLTDLVVNTGVLAGSTWAALFRNARDCVVTRMVVNANVVTSAVDARAWYLMGARRFKITDCRMNYDCWGVQGGSNEQHAMGIRDHARYNTFVRDTFWVGMNSTHSRALLLTQQGSASGSVLGNAFYNCDFRSRWMPEADGFVWTYDGLLGTRFVSCLFADSAGTPVNIDHGSGGVFQNCTFYSATSAKAIIATVANPTSTRFGGCVFAGPGTPVCPGSWAANGLVVLGSVGAAGFDSCAFASPDTSKLLGAVVGNACGNSLRDWVRTTGENAHSKELFYAPTIFTDTRWGTLDLRPSVGSPLLAITAPGGVYGAFLPTTATYTITSSTDAGGTISPTGIRQVTQGGSLTYTIGTRAYYTLSDVLVDGISVGATASYTFSNVTTSHTIAVVTTQDSYTITASAGTGGIILPSGTLTNLGGTNRQLVVAPSAGYHIAGVLVDGSSVGAVGVYNFTTIVADHTIAASFAANNYTVASSVVGNGSVNSPGSVVFTYGDNLTSIPVPDPNWHVEDVIVDGAHVGVQSSWTFSSISANHTIVWVLAQDLELVTATNVPGGSIKPAGVMQVVVGDSSARFTATPGYHSRLLGLNIDGDDVIGLTSYAFTNVTESHTIHPIFAVDSTTILAVAGDNGTITPSGLVSVAYGGDQTFAIAPNTGYHQTYLEVDYGSVPVVNSYNFHAVQGPHEISALFAINTYSITATAGAHGNITNPGATSLNYGDSKTYTITPDTYYHIALVLKDGVNVGTPSLVTFTNISGNHSVVVAFAPNVVGFGPRSSLWIVDPSRYPGSPWWPLLSANGATIDTTRLRNYSRYGAVMFPSNSADSSGAYGRTAMVSVIQQLRALNPSIQVLPCVSLEAAFYRTGSEALAGQAGAVGDSTADPYNIIFQMWRAARVGGGGWTTGSGKTGPVPSLPTDSTGSRGFLWNKTAGYKGFFLQQYAFGGASGTPGSTNCNINIAWKSGGKYVVADSLVAIFTRHFITRKAPDGTWLYDGLATDLALNSLYDQTRDTVDYVRAGYATRALLDTAWYDAHAHLLAALRDSAIANGRATFVLLHNGGNQVSYPTSNAWMSENWPAQQGGTWLGNFTKGGGPPTRSGGNRQAAGGQNAGAWGYGNDIFGSALIGCYPYGQDSTLIPAKADTLSLNTAKASYALSTAALTGASTTFACGVTSGGYDKWWWDELAVDTTTAKAVKDYQHQNWLGQPLGHWYNSVPAASGSGRLGGKGAFEGTDSTAWTKSAPAGNYLRFQSADTHGGTVAFQADIGVPDPADGNPYQTTLTYSTALADTAAKVRQVTFWAKASFDRPIRVVLNGQTSGSDRSGWLMAPVWIGSDGWHPYRVQCTLSAGATENTKLAFWLGDTTGTVWLDDVRLDVGSRGGSYIRDYEHGVAVVNPTGAYDTLLAWRPMRHIKSLVVSHPSNNGRSYSKNTKLIVGPSSGFLMVAGGVGPGDSTITTPPVTPPSNGTHYPDWFYRAIRIIFYGGKH